MSKTKRPTKIDIKKALTYYNANNRPDGDVYMTYQSLAYKMGVTRQTLYNYAHGISAPNIDDIKSISKITGLAICEFVPIKIDRK